MSDLIDRQAALALAKDICVPTKDGTVYRHRCIDPQQIIELPSAEPDRKKGKWEYPRKFGHTHLMGKCSVCGKYESAEWIVLDKPDFCPHCGARLEWK